jgi:hypothetical protein
MEASMSKRTSILKALISKLNEGLDGVNYRSNMYNNCHSSLRFWDEVNQFMAIYSSPGSEQREYLPGAFTWAYLGISLKLYCKGEDAQEQLEQLLEDVESIIDANRVLVYDTVNNYETTEILISSITTDEGLLAPYAVGEMNLQVRYALP